MSERLRRWTRNPLGSARRGSNPLGVVFLKMLVFKSPPHASIFDHTAATGICSTSSCARKEWATATSEQPPKFYPPPGSTTKQPHAPTQGLNNPFGETPHSDISNSLRDKPPPCLSPQDFWFRNFRCFFLVVRFVAFILPPFWRPWMIIFVPFWRLLDLRGRALDHFGGFWATGSNFELIR